MLVDLRLFFLHWSNEPSSSADTHVSAHDEGADEGKQEFADKARKAEVLLPGGFKPMSWPSPSKRGDGQRIKNYSRMIPTTAENQICGKVEEHQARRLSNNFDEPVPQVTFHLYMSVCAHVRMCVCVCVNILFLS